MDETQKVGPLISVIIPAFNAEKTIERCLKALTAQTIPSDKYEIILVDDGSEDRTAPISKSYAIQYFYQENAGPAMARNAGVQNARGDLILFTDSDCEATENFIEEMIKPFNDPSVVGVKGIYRTRQNQLWARFAQVEFEERYSKLSRSSTIDFVDSHAAAFRKDVFLEVGGFDPHFPVANNEDVDLSYKIARLGYKMVFNPDAIIFHEHPANIKKYLRIKFFRAYWRMLVYRRFPEKIVSDTYTPQSMKLQIVATAAILLALGGSIIWPVLLKVIPYLSALLIATFLPFLTHVMKHDPRLIGFSVFALILRAFVFGIGITGGLLAQRRRELLFPVILVISDIITAIAAYSFAYWVRVYLIAYFFRRFDHTFGLYLSIFPVVLLFWLIAFHSQGLYRTNIPSNSISEFAKVTRASSMSVFAIITICYFWKWDFSRGFIILYWIFAVVFSNLSRNMIRSLQTSFRQKGYHLTRTLIVGTGEAGRLVLKRLIEHHSTGIRIIGLADDKSPADDDPDWRDIPFLGSIDTLERIIRDNAIDDVFIARTDLPHHQILDLVVRCEKTGAGFKIVSDQVSILTAGAGLSPYPGLPIIDLREERHTYGRYLAKRIEDLVIGGLLFFLVLPLFMLIAAIIKYTIEGPVFNKEERVGKNGRLFKMVRFRVHPPDVHNISAQPKSLIGKFLRKTYLEELPQLLNVIFGEMSLVGPRPEVPEIVATYAPWQRKRLEVAPGLTGLWQVTNSKDRPLHEDLESDFFYIKNHDIWMDLSILLRTIPLVVFGKGKLGV